MYVYRFLNDKDEIIYIGRSKNLDKRLYNHNHLPEECYKEIKRIEYAICKNDDESSICERYFINIFSPKYNTQYNNNSKFNFEIPNLEWNKYYNIKDYNILDRINIISIIKDNVEYKDELEILITLLDKSLYVNCDGLDGDCPNSLKNLLKMNNENFKQFIKYCKHKNILSTTSISGLRDTYHLRENCDIFDIKTKWIIQKKRDNRSLHRE